MKAIQFTNPNTINVNDIPLPQVPAGFSLLKISHAGICGTDLNIYAGTHPRAKAPLTIGHEFSGFLTEDTYLPDGQFFPKGSAMTAYPLISCMKCRPCQDGNKHVCNTLGLYGIDTDGGMAEYVAVPTNQLIPIPEGVSMQLGAFIEPIAVTVHALRETGFKPGDNAFVFGCGTIGLCLALTLRQFGASDIILSETDPARISIAEKLGFKVISPIGCDLVKFTMERTGGNGFDRIYDCAGVPTVANKLFDVVRVKGQIVIVASYKHPAELPLFKGMAKELTIAFTRVYRKEDFQIAAKMAVNVPEYENIITHILPYEEAQKGFDLLFTKGTGAIKVMYKF